MQERTDIAAREVQERTNMTVRQEHATTRSGTVKEVQLANARNQMEHEITRQEIAQVKRAIDQLREEMKQRNSEWKALLLELTNPETSRRKEELWERKNAVSVMLMALEAVHRILLVRILCTISPHV